MKYKYISGLAALITTTILWGSSFPAIKLTVSSINEYAYVGFRSLIALIGLLPYTVYYHVNKGFNKHVAVGGLIIGVIYSIGLWLQGWGMKYTTASNAAFITGLNVVFVHLYSALRHKRYSKLLALSITIALLGLYILTNPATTINPGDLLVLLGAVAWAAYVILVSKYSKHNPIIMTFYTMIPPASYLVVLLHNTTPNDWSTLASTMWILAYLAMACSNVATILQLYGQRYVRVEVAAIIYLLEPVFAAILSYITLGEILELNQLIGATLILLAMLIAILDEYYYKEYTNEYA